MMLDELARVVRFVSAKLAEKGEAEQIGHRTRRKRAADDREQRTVARVDAASFRGPLATLRVVTIECRAVQQFPTGFHLIDQADFVAILQVRADAVQRMDRLDTVPFEFLLRTDSAQHQELRRIEGAGGENDLAARERHSRLSCSATWSFERTVEPLPLEIRHADRAVAVENDLGRMRIELDAKREAPRHVEQS